MVVVTSANSILQFIDYFPILYICAKLSYLLLSWVVSEMHCDSDVLGLKSTTQCCHPGSNCSTGPVVVPLTLTDSLFLFGGHLTCRYSCIYWPLITSQTVWYHLNESVSIMIDLYLSISKYTLWLVSTERNIQYRTVPGFRTSQHIISSSC